MAKDIKTEHCSLRAGVEVLWVYADDIDMCNFWNAPKASDTFEIHPGEREDGIPQWYKRMCYVKTVYNVYVLCM